MDCFVVDTEKYVAKVGEEVVLFDEKLCKMLQKSETLSTIPFLLR